DLIIFGKDMASINDLKAQLNEEYEMKDLGELKYFLGIQVHRDRERKIIHINQAGYNRTILERYGMQNSKPASTPLATSARLVKEAKVSCPVYHGIRIHGSPSRSQGAHMAPSVSQRNRLRHRQSEHHLHRQSRCDRTRAQPGTPRSYEARRYPVSLRQKLRRRWNDKVGILSNGGYGCGRLDEGVGTGKAQEIGKDDGYGCVAKV